MKLSADVLLAPLVLSLLVLIGGLHALHQSRWPSWPGSDGHSTEQQAGPVIRPCTKRPTCSTSILQQATLDEILLAIEEVSTPACNLTSLHAGLMEMVTLFGTLEIDNSQPDSISITILNNTFDIVTALEQLSGNVQTLSGTLDIGRILVGQTNIQGLITEALVLLNDFPQQDITDLISNVTQIAASLESVMTDITALNQELDTLKDGQEQICDKIVGLDAKLDTILAQLNGSGSGGGSGGGSGSGRDNCIGNRCFIISDNMAKNGEAKQMCENAGGHLATMTEENSEILYTLASIPNNGGQRAWIGLMKGEGWGWHDSSAYGYTDWEGDEPDRNCCSCGVAKADSSGVDGSWLDRNCMNNNYYICQKDD